MGLISTATTLNFENGDTVGEILLPLRRPSAHVLYSNHLCTNTYVVDFIPILHFVLFLQVFYAVISVSDNATTSLSCSGTVTITVTDDNDEVPTIRFIINNFSIGKQIGCSDGSLVN